MRFFFCFSTLTQNQQWLYKSTYTNLTLRDWEPLTFYSDKNDLTVCLSLMDRVDFAHTACIKSFKQLKDQQVLYWCCSSDWHLSTDYHMHNIGSRLWLVQLKYFLTAQINLCCAISITQPSCQSWGKEMMLSLEMCSFLCSLHGPSCLLSVWNHTGVVNEAVWH